MSPILILAMSVSAALPIAEVEEFKDNRDGTATLTAVCTAGNRVHFRVDRKHLNKMNVDTVYAIIKVECSKEQP